MPGMRVPMERKGGRMSGHRFDWKWNLSDLHPDKDIKVLTCFSCGGGSSMGYKKAGFHVLGNVEIDPKINAMYVKNHHPKYNFNMDLRKFNEKQDIPEELSSGYSGWQSAVHFIQHGWCPGKELGQKEEV